MDEPQIKILQPGHEAALEAFLRPRTESSMFLLSNMRAAGLADTGRRFEGSYAAAFEGGRMVGVAAHYWNNGLVYQAPVHLAALTGAAIGASGRPAGRLIGPADQIDRAVEILGLAGSDFRLDEREGLYRLWLDDLIVPPDLTLGRVQARRLTRRDVELAIRWRVAYCLEVLGETDSPQLREECRTGVENALQAGRTWILESAGKPVALTSFNAAIAEALQVGGVWTPPELRGRGYARCVVAASLLGERGKLVKQAILFTGDDNIPAQKAYRALGFRRIGDFRLVILRRPVRR